MQKIVRIILSLLMMVAYMVTSIGFGVHECSAKGTKYILFINTDKSCEQIHNHCSCNLGLCSLEKHSNKCCSTKIHHLDFAYDITDAGAGDSLSSVSQVNYLPLFALSISHKMASYVSTNFEFQYGPPIYSKTDKIFATLAQWRL